MLQTASVVTLLIGMMCHVASAAKCKLNIGLYSDNSCSTYINAPPYYTNGIGNFDLTFNKCWSPDGNYGMKVLMCDETEFVALAYFVDS